MDAQRFESELQCLQKVPVGPKWDLSPSGKLAGFFLVTCDISFSKDLRQQHFTFLVISGYSFCLYL